MALTQADVKFLASGATTGARAEIAEKVARQFAGGALNLRERELAVSIFRLLVRDAEMRVRQALSRNLCRSKDAPHDVIFALAQDDEDVALPVLEFSDVLGDSDLIMIIESAIEVAKWVAIAHREIVSERVSDALLATENVEVARELFGNPGAGVKEKSILKTISQMAEYESVMDVLLRRGGLPVTCVEAIITSVSDAMKKRLIQRHQLSRHLVEGRFEYAREWATLGVAEKADDGDVHELVAQLQASRRLTSSMVIRSLCVGDLRFFAAAMARLTGVAEENVTKLMRDAGDMGFRSLYRASPLPPAYYDAVKKVLDLALELTRNGKEMPDDYYQRLIDKIHERGYDLTVEHMPLLLAIIKGNAGEFPSIH